ncbi:MAG: MATE family efflux transporter [Lachnospiraceae bacterium]|nr:MATE family efflux transporter [Lachnospiraceae bacterium]
MKIMYNGDGKITKEWQVFQQLYNIVDSYVVGNFVDTNALAAVGASGSVINMLVGFFMGLSAGAGVVISQYFGARKLEEMRAAIHSALALTGVLSVVFTAAGVIFTKPLLRMIGIPDEVLPHSSLYLTIYFSGIVFSLFYNMGAGILRAVGDSRNPLLYLAAASIVNIILDFVLVCGFQMGIAGVGIATIIAQAVSSTMVLRKLMCSREAYRVELREIRFHSGMVRQITAIGFPTALQQSITALSNVIVQSYINSFGAVAIAGYSAAVRVDGILQLVLQSFNMTITTFVGQNIGARQFKRVRRGIWTAWMMSSVIIVAGCVVMNLKGALLVGVFTNDADVIFTGQSILKLFSWAYWVLPIVQILNGALRGAGKSRIPMYFMVGSFVVLRQIYLMIAVPMTHRLMTVMAGWPITWVICAAGMLIYFLKADWLLEAEEAAGDNVCER